MKKILSFILALTLISLLCACGTENSDDKDTKSLVGTWEYSTELYDDPLYTLEFYSDGSASLSFSLFDGNIDKYYCEDSILYLENTATSISMKLGYRFSDDKDTLYISEVDSSSEMIFHRVSPAGDNAVDGSTSDGNDMEEIYDNMSEEEQFIVGDWWSTEELDDGTPALEFIFYMDGSGDIIGNEDSDESLSFTSFATEDNLLYLQRADGKVAKLAYQLDKEERTMSLYAEDDTDFSECIITLVKISVD